ncbi:MAG: metalloregulator ArsR/SmtB family transcription factor [Ferruginibacter sp.]
MRRDVFQAIADPVRREIIGLIAVQPLNLNMVAGHFEISRPAISKHIRILTECGLITIRQEGRERFCEPDFEKIRDVADWASQYKTFWTKKLDALETFLLKEQKQKKKK